MPWHGEYAGSGAGWLVMLMVMIALVTIVAVAVVLAVQAGRHRRDAPGTDRPEQVLAERFARGEIDAEEYQRRSALLRSERH